MRAYISSTGHRNVACVSCKITTKQALSSTRLLVEKKKLQLKHINVKSFTGSDGRIVWTISSTGTGRCRVSCHYLLSDLADFQLQRRLAREQVSVFGLQKICLVFLHKYSNKYFRITHIIVLSNSNFPTLPKNYTVGTYLNEKLIV